MRGEMLSCDIRAQVCIYHGDASGALARWLVALGVRLVFHHEPKWKPKLESAMLKAAGHQSRSPLYAQLASMIGTFLRLDIPTLGFVDEFVLYTDVDVLFVQARA